MESDSSRLWDILSKASQDVELEEGEIRFAVNSLSGPSIGDRAYACEVLFRAAPSQLMKQQALNTLEELCNTDVEGEHVMTMMTVMLFIPLSALDRPPLELLQ